MDTTRADQASAFIDTLPFCRALRISLVDIGSGWAELRMPYSDEIVGDPATGVIHGGAISALMDTTSGAAVMSHPEAGDTTATLDLRIDYMRGAVPGREIMARADCFHVTRRIAFVRAVAHDGDAANPVATVTGAFTVDRRVARS